MKQSSPLRQKTALDIDAMTKDIVTAFFREFILFVNPRLYEAIDWSVAPVFLEQELFNSLKGKYRIRGKQKRADKLVKLRLLDGTEQLILIHCEFQHRPEEQYGKRMFGYFALIFLRYEPDHFTAITFFTGAPPARAQLEYSHDEFGTVHYYKFVSIVAAEQDEQTLIDSNNPFALIVLAAQYAWRTEGKPAQRVVYKKKLFDLVRKRGFDDEKLIKLLIFVFDFVHLPTHFENGFLRETSDIIFPSIDTIMETSAGVKKMADLFYERAYGVNPKKELQAVKREAKREREAAVQREREAAVQREREAAAQREAAQREAAQREHELIMYKLYQSGMPVAHIATLLGYDSEYVERLVNIALEKTAKNTGT
jgi:hypothetical protein